MLGWEFPPYNSGGLGVACEGLARALIQENVSVTFVLPKRFALSDSEIKFRFADVEGTRIRRVDTMLQPYLTSREYELKKRFFDNTGYGGDLLAEVLRYAGAVATIAEEEEFDVIHAHDWLAFLAGVVAKEVSGRPLVLHSHITSFDQSGGDHVDPRVYRIEHIGFHRADAVVAVSNHVKNIIVDKYHMIPDRVRVIHNGVNTRTYLDSSPEIRKILALKRSHKKIVLYMGRLTMHKGPDYFLRAAKKVLEHHPNTLFVIAGSGDMEWQLVRLAADLGIANNVFFAGFARGEEACRLYRSADLYVLPSVSEPFGLTPLESLISGTPTLISKQSGVSEVLQNTLKVDFWDVDEMANKIVAVLRHPPLAKQLTFLGRGEALLLTWGRAAKQCVDLYNALTGSLVRT